MGATEILFKFLGDNTSLKKTTGDSEKDLDTFKGSMTSWSSKVGSIAKKTGLAIAAGMAAGGAAALKYTKDSVDAAESQDKATLALSRSTGLNTKAASQYLFVAQQSGKTSDDLQKAFKALSKNALGPASKEMNLVGIATKDAKGNFLDANTIFKNTADVISKMPDGLQKNQLAMKVFGKSGQDLIPILNKGSAGIDALQKKADAFGYTIGDDSVADIKKHLAAQRDMQAAWKGAQIQLGNAILPTLTKVSVWFAKELPFAIAYVKAKIPEFIAGFKRIKTDIMPYIEDFKRGWTELTDGWQGFKQNFTNGVTIVKGVLQGWWDSFQAGSVVVLHVMQSIGQAIMDVYNFIKPVLDLLVSIFQGAWDLIWGIVKGAFDIIWGVISGAFDMIKGIFSTVMGVLTGNWTAAWNGIKDILQGIWNVIGGVISGAWAIIKGVFQAGINGIQGIWNFGWAVISGAISAAWGVIGGIWSGAWTILKGVVQTGVNDVTTIINTIGSIVTGACSGIWDVLKSGFKTAINWIIDGINLLPKAANSIISHIPGLSSLQIPLIPHLAKGAIVDSPTLALIGEAGKEVVFPTNNPQSGYAMLAKAGVPPPSQGGGGGVKVYQNITAFDPRTTAVTANKEAVWAWKTSGR